MSRPILFVGLGGSGGKTLRYAAQQIEYRLEANGWTGGMPVAWRFLNIDVPTEVQAPTGDEPMDVGKRHNFRYLGLANAQLQYSVYDDKLRAAGGEGLGAALAGWAPNPNDPGIRNPSNGAGQKRVVGRVLGLATAERISDAIDQESRAMASKEAKTEMGELMQTLSSSKESLSTDQDPLVIVVTSMGGGSGSGLFNDVVELLKARAEFRKDLTTVIFSSDIFSGLSTKQAGVYPNALASISELLSGFYHVGFARTPEAELLTSALQLSPSGRRTADTNLIVSGGNGNLVMSDPSASYKSIGRFLAVLATSPRVMAEAYEYRINNAQGLDVSEEFRIAEAGAAGGAVAPANAVGFASVSLGRDLFKDYATGVLAREALNALLEVDVEEEGMSEKQFLEEKADGEKPGFMDALGLNEYGPDFNQVQDALDFPSDSLKKKWKKAKSSTSVGGRAFERTLEDQIERAGENSRDDQFRLIRSSYRSVGEAFIAEQKSVLDQRADQLATEIQERAVRAVSRSVARDGVKLTLLLLEQAKEEVVQAAGEMKIEAEKRESSAAKIDSTLKARLRDLAERVTGHELADGKVGEILDLEPVTAVSAHGFRKAELLLKNSEKGLLEPLAQAVRRLENDLIEARDSEEGKRDRIMWGDGRDVPSHLSPPENVNLLEDPLDDKVGFASSLATALSATFDRSPDAMADSVTELVSGMFEKSEKKDAKHQQPETGVIKVERAWGGASSTDRMSCEVKINTTADLAELAKLWIRTRKDSKVRAHVEETLSIWLDTSHPDATKRGSRFVASLATALSQAEPMVVIDEAVYQKMYSKSPDQPGYLLTPIPMPSGHPAHGKVVDLLTKHLGDPKRATSQIDSGVAQHATEVDVTAFLANPVHPVVMTSVMDPIRRDWEQSSPAENTRSAFWSYRRARSLDTFVPVPRTTQTTLVRGWIVATVLNQLDGASDPQQWMKSGISIWTPDGDRRFPRYPLGARIDARQEILPLVLQSLPLAFLSFSAGRTEEVEAYNRLLDLGNPDDSGGIQAPGSSGSRLSEPMLSWLEAGVPETGREGDAPLPNPQFSGPATAAVVDASVDHVAARISAFREVLKDSKKNAESWAKLRTDLRKSYPLSFPLHGEIGEMGIEAVEALMSGLNAYEANRGSGAAASAGVGL